MTDLLDNLPVDVKELTDNKPVYIYLTKSDSLDPELLQKYQSLDSLVSGLNVIISIFHKRLAEAAGRFDDSGYQNIHNTALGIEGVVRSIEGVTSYERSVKEIVSNPQLQDDEKVAIKQKSTQAWDKDLALLDKVAADNEVTVSDNPELQLTDNPKLQLADNQAYMELKIQSASDLESGIVKFLSISHALRNRLTGLLWFSLQDTLKLSSRDSVNHYLISGIKGLGEYLGQLPVFLTDNYNERAKSQILFSKLASVIQEELDQALGQNKIQTSYLPYPQDLRNLHINWANHWLIILMDNIAQNTPKAYQRRDELTPDRSLEPKTLKVGFSYQEDQGVLVMTFEDRGSGVENPNLINDGKFKFGEKGWGEGSKVKSTAVGLASDSDILSKYYQGDISFENVIDRDNKIVGFKLTVKIPAKKITN